MKDVDTEAAIGTTEDFESYLYIITHDLKTYSRAMRVIPEWIEEDLLEAGMQLPGDVAGHVTMLRDYAAGMDRMLDGLTDLSRVGRLADDPSEIPLCSFVGAAWARLKPPDGFRLDISCLDGTVWAPANDLDRLVTALLSNAVIHHDGASGLIVVTSETDGDRLVLRVADDGPGIDTAYREKVFQPLYTLKPKDEVGTAGMGLAISRKVVTLLGGDIAIQPQAGPRGTVVVCDLPRV